MEYGLWNLHGGFWAGNNPCGTDGVSRSIYNSVNPTLSAPQFQSCAENMAYPGTASSPPCRTYRGPQDYMTMKQTSISTRGSSENIGLPEDVTEQGSVMPLQMEMVTEQSSIESVNSLQAQSGPGTSSPHHKKVKLTKHQRKSPHVPGRESESPWNPGVKPENFGNPQYNASMYSMMFGRLPIKRTDMISDESEDEDDDDYDNVEGEGYSNQSSMDVKSQQRELVAESSGPRLGYECGECDMVADTRPSLKKHIAVCHPLLAPDSALITKTSSACPMATCRFRTSERDEMEAHVARHVAEGYSPTGKKRSGPISLQRVRYEREEYRCQICAYSCTIEKAFYKHLKIHSLGLTAPSVKISCVICGKDRPTEVEMNKHMRKHRDNRYFCCDICVFRTVQLKKANIFYIIVT
ncbi:unnamed protein product [Timema podura]|uniref:C2H2-type domain-containing protein n=1 Tax=Timema podura TaxID=61482 RepID=A0ABN7NQS3_TIMPD|nr:unnamed protein product [Timema podura]